MKNDSFNKTATFDKEVKESCGVFGVANHPHAAMVTVLGLFALQHRGEEACGLAVCDGENIYLKTGLGQVSQNFDNKSIDGLKGDMGVGHTRYSITGSPNIKNIQPLKIDHSKGKIAVAHNGNLTNAIALRHALEEEGAIFQTSMDSEVILHLIVKSKKISIKEKIFDALKKITGSYCLIIMTEDMLYAVRDPRGFRPMCIGTLLNGKSTVVASETSALDLVSGKYIREIEPGECVSISKNGTYTSDMFVGKEKQLNPAKCIFELVYFSRPDSMVFSKSVYQFRKNLGRTLARESPVEADMVIPVPDSGMYAALGYAEVMGLPFEIAITRNHYVGRSFIQPTQALRESFVKIKLNPIKNIINGRRIVIVDDSIVRGTTTRERIRTLREAGAKEVHLRISSPPIKHACYFGIDFPDKEKLIANKGNLKEIADYLNLDSMSYISLSGMIEAAGNESIFCHACYSGEYPIDITERPHKRILE